MYQRKKEIDWETSKLISASIEAEIGECVANVGRAILQIKDQLPDNSVFVEGLYKVGGQLGLHAWIETETTIIDPTVVLQTPSVLREQLLHFPIKTLSMNDAIEYFRSLNVDKGGFLHVSLDWSDEQVIRVAHEVDPP